MADALQPVLTTRDDTAGGSHLPGVRSRYFLRGEQTGGAYSMTEIVFQPGGGGTPLHVHRREEEMYYVIEGQLFAQVGERTMVLEAGGSVLLPRGVPHKVVPAGDVATRVLMVVTPPGFELLLAEFDGLNADGKLSMDVMGARLAEHEIELVPETAPG